MSAAPRSRAFRHASDIAEDVRNALLRREEAANTILPFSKQAMDFPRGGDSEQLWIAIYDGPNDVAFVLSCTKGPLGNYPIFIVSCKSPAELAEEETRGPYLADAMLFLVQRLLGEVPPQRVFSVFALAPVAEKFAEAFVSQLGPEHGIRILKDPYYDATLTFCSGETLRRPSESVSTLSGSDDVTIHLRLAEERDLGALKIMCKEFSETSPPFILDYAGAELEAKKMIKNQQVWVHAIEKAGEEPKIACLVATTRESDNVTAVTKVYTPESWRGRGCAARLLHRICHEILQKKKRVVLYVGNSPELVPARRVYHKIGFQGLGEPRGQEIEGVEKWLEIGFEGTTLGHW